MKAFSAAALIISLSCIPLSYGASITVTDNTSSLSDVAGTLTAVLLDAGVPPRKAADHTYVVEIKDLHCDHYSRAALGASDPHAALSNDTCRVNAKNVKGTKTGQVFPEARMIADLLSRISQSAGKDGPSFSDCAMGYCGIFAKSIRCTINTKIENFKDGGRWSCTIVTDQL